MLTMKMKRYSITSYNDLEREEKRIQQRLKNQEEAIRLKLKKLPEELILSGVTKLITDILNGQALKTTIGVVKLIGSVLLSDKQGGILNTIWSTIKTAIKAKA